MAGVQGALRLVQMIAIMIWVGGLIFFAFVLAPTAFRTLPNVHEAGLIVGATLRVFDFVALGCGALFLAATALMTESAGTPVRRRLRVELALAGAMVLGTSYLQWGILPPMEVDRARAGGDINSVAPTDPARVHFDKLHARSERVEGGVLLLGLAVVLLMSRETMQVRASTVVRAG